MALGLYTALPGFARWDDDCQGMLAAMLPLVGVVLGGLWWGIGALCSLRPSLLTAVCVALAVPLLTGFFHLDGYMDVADAVLSGRPREDKVRILKDPHTGAFAVIALACLLLAQTAAAYDLLPTDKPLGTLLCLPVISRAMAGWAVMSIKPMPESGYGRMNYDMATRAGRAFCALCLIAACLLAFALDMRAGIACLAAALSFALVCWRAVRALGGMNGDIAGCANCCAELGGLIALSLL